MWYCSEVGDTYYPMIMTSLRRKDFKIKNTDTNEEISVSYNKDSQESWFTIQGTDLPCILPDFVYGIYDYQKLSKDLFGVCYNIAFQEHVIIAISKQDLKFLDYVDSVKVIYSSSKEYLNRSFWNYDIIPTDTTKTALIYVANLKNLLWISLFKYFKIANNLADIPYNFDNKPFIGVDDANNVLIINFKKTFTKSVYSKLLFMEG